MFTTSRITKKRTTRAVCRALSIPLALSHAKPSFWALPLKARRHHLRRVLIRRLDCSPKIATYVTRQWGTP